MINYNISEIADNEMREFAMYTIANRAIPNMIDGLKPVQRFYLYSSLVNTPKDFKKVSAVSGVVSDYGYNHGETSAAGAGQLMAATWNNNICLVEGRGSFGTRQVQQAGAARYVYTRVHENFSKYIQDIELSPEHYDPEHTPPQFYIPVIPLVLANGTKGIATGFATNILPRSEKDIIKACKDFVTKGKISKRLGVSFPDFKGSTVYDTSTDRFICTGKFERPSKTQVIITEIPYGYDRESYVKILDKLDDDDVIVSYEDQCSNDGFRFEIKLKIMMSNKLNTDEKVIKAFKLEKTHAENLTVIDPNFKLREYTDERELIKDFCEFRLGVLQTRIDKSIERYEEEVRWLGVKAEFIQAVLEDKIIFKGQNKSQVSKQILSSTSALNDDCDRLLRMNLLTLTMEQIKELMGKMKEASTLLKYWNNTSPNEQFINDLGSIKM
jgi:DNA gyrase/topoisomerase IV subunit A